MARGARDEGGHEDAREGRKQGCLWLCGRSKGGWQRCIVGRREDEEARWCMRTWSRTAWILAKKHEVGPGACESSVGQRQSRALGAEKGLATACVGGRRCRLGIHIQGGAHAQRSSRGWHRWGAPGDGGGRLGGVNREGEGEGTSSCTEKRPPRVGSRRIKRRERRQRAAQKRRWEVLKLGLRTRWRKVSVTGGGFCKSARERLGELGFALGGLILG